MYLDVQATSPVDPRVIDVMNQMHFCVEETNKKFLWIFRRTFFSVYVFEWETKVAKLVNADPKEIVFTSGATESNNLAIKGAAYFPRRKEKKHLITVQTEHKCVLDSCRQLEMDGYTVTYLPVQSNGILDLNLLASKITENTLLVSVMHINNEVSVGTHLYLIVCWDTRDNTQNKQKIGVIQPIKEIGQICREKGVYFHCDAAQSLGKVPIDVNELNVDLMSFSGHKIYGPKGIGALFVRRRPRVQLRPIISGGGQERGMRSGTLPAPLVVGFGKACELARLCVQEDHAHVSKLSAKLLQGIQERLVEATLNGDKIQRYPGNLNISFAFVEGESLLMGSHLFYAFTGLKNVCVSSGSACTSASLEPSYVLRAIGVSDDLAHTSIRFGIGRFTTEEEIDYTIAETVKHVTRLREMSPLFDLWKEGLLNKIQWTQH
ncbi:cysteine desulfurylase [Reticulomyxa filosa]|uniref:cysteine desulfurase n=1 Tax=Reticulomyxa filosa TaxID=46433 RepID=X6MJN0_RETFI|nr:cysteine desulfurylase [Reticulomyxa filosa]|eukprot:ETO13652.1 cysteine desulfurylase [Reticulomyxa filosa]